MNLYAQGFLFLHLHFLPRTPGQINKRPDLVVLQSRSPNSGVNEIYDGSFSGKRIPGIGVFAKAASDAGSHVVDIENLADLLTGKALEKE